MATSPGARATAPSPREPPAVLYEKAGGVGIVSLNRPHVLNAYNLAMRDALFEILCAIRDDPEVRAVVLRGNGPAFCTGGDVREFGSAPSPVGARDARWHRDVWRILRALPQPTIAAAHGYVVGGGFEIALLCDLCLAATDARFSLPEAALGMIPGVAGTQTAPRALGLGRAMDLVLTCRWLDAREAHRFGIVTRTVPRARLHAAAIDLAQRLCKLPPQLVASVKQAVQAALDLNLPDGLALEHRLNLRLESGAAREYV
ncbi:MAG: enoyl-CoA hydratase/isomerase family protein [Candidatus Binatia bacterium]